MKKLLNFISLTFIFGLLVSCTNYENSGATVSFTFNPADFYKNSGARDVPISSTAGSDTFYLVASIMGDYSDTKVIPIFHVQSQTVEFTSVPVGAEVNVMVYVCNNADPIFYNYGKSAAKKVVSGINPVKLHLTQFSADSFEPFYFDIDGIIDLNNIKHNGITVNDSFDFQYSENGVYYIVNGGMPISAGFYTMTNGILTFTECIYQSLNFDFESGETSDTSYYTINTDSPDLHRMIVTEPKSQKLHLSPGASKYFISRNGLTYEILWSN